MFDESCVEFYKGADFGNFDIYFDEKLYEAPESVVRMEARLNEDK